MSSPVIFSTEPGKAKWPDVRTACLRDKLKFCFFVLFVCLFFLRPIRIDVPFFFFFLLSFKQ